MATWRNGYAEDCKSLYPGSIPGVASKKNLVLVIKKSKLSFLYSSVAQLVEQLTVNQLVAGSSPARGAKNIYPTLEIVLLVSCKDLLNFNF
jgi:hypothetical protein